MADTKPIKSLPVRVQFTLNPVAHPDAIKLLSSLAQSDLAGAVADLVQWGAMLKCSMAQGQFAILTNLAQIQAAASLAGQPVPTAASTTPAPTQANVHQLPAPRMTKDMLAGAFDFSGVRQ